MSHTDASSAIGKRDADLMHLRVYGVRVFFKDCVSRFPTQNPRTLGEQDLDLYIGEGDEASRAKLKPFRLWVA